MSETNMNHITEERLILHYYGELGQDAAGVAEHLASCGECRAEMGHLQQVLAALQIEVPARGDGYGAQVWHNLKGQLPEPQRKRRWWQVPHGAGYAGSRKWAAAGVLAAIMLASFFAGRSWQKNQGEAAPTEAQRLRQRDRVLLVAVGDHLEKSQIILVELANMDARSGSDIRSEKSAAEDLLTANRLYRQSALRDNEPAVANLLDELERMLIDIAHTPDNASGTQLEELRQRIEGQGILFKVRVVGTQVRERERQQDKKQTQDKQQPKQKA